MAGYLRYVLKNIEPLRIADDSTSQSGQTNTLRYIPGTAIRGLVINALAKDEDFEDIRKELFSDQVKYLNAYPVTDGREMLPSPKGFYENKVTRKEIENVVIDGTFTEGYKRADLGRFARLDGDTVYYGNVDTDSDMKIKINVSGTEKQNVFRSEYIKAGNVFAGYIAVPSEEIGERIKKVFSKDVILGNARSSGFGKCRILELTDEEDIPFSNYMPTADVKGSCYMLLLSHTVMRNETGEYCGLNLSELKERMGVENLRAAYCSTSVKDVRGYNRAWGVKIPSVMMYEQGSVFHFTFDGVLSVEKMKELMDQGIGVRKNEGFGRILFVGNYEDIKFKCEGKMQTAGPEKIQPGEKEDAQVLKLVAGTYYKNLLRRKIQQYIVEHPIMKEQLGNSQLGKLEAFTTAYRYDPKAGKEAIEKYFGHAKEKEDNQRTQKERSSIKGLASYVDKIFSVSLEKILDMEEKTGIMGINKTDILSENEIYRMKMDLLTGLIRYDNKKEVR